MEDAAPPRPKGRGSRREKMVAQGEALKSVEEMTAWSQDEIMSEILSLIPKDWVFSLDPDIEGRIWLSSFKKPNEEGILIEVWSDSGVDARLLLLNAFAHLWLQKQPQVSPLSPWVRRRELPRGASPLNFFSEIPDPEDLDPQQVSDFYAKCNKKHGD